MRVAKVKEKREKKREREKFGIDVILTTPLRRYQVRLHRAVYILALPRYAIERTCTGAPHVIARTHMHTKYVITHTHTHTRTHIRA